MQMRLAVVLIAVAALCTAAWGYPSLLGPSGIVQTPNTDVTQTDTVEFAVDYLSMDSDQFAIPVRLTAGIADKAELGLAYLKTGDDLDGRIVNFNAKVALQREPDYPFGLAVGLEFGDLGEDFFEMQGLDRMVRVYAVASRMLTPLPDGEEKTVSTDIRGQVGINWVRIENGASEDSLRPFAGVEFATARGTVIGLEWRSEEFGDDVLSAAIRHPFNDSAYFQIGITKNLGGLAVSNDTGAFAGLGYRFRSPS